jgi:indole-3-glycerol phosphate synthase
VTAVRTGTILDRILEQTRLDVAARQAAWPVDRLREMAGQRAPALSLRDALRGPGVAVIAEIKRASPSRGTFPVVVDPARVTAEYVAGGAAAISVLTDEPFFRGSLADLEAAAAIAHGHRVPVLRKDFIVDAYQIVEARAHGADAILLIVAALGDAELAELLGHARRLGMDALVEVHDDAEMARAAATGAEVIGINNRDLRTFTVDLAVTERLAPLAPKGAVVVSESGIFGATAMARVARAGADAVLAGEGLIVQEDRAEAVRGLAESGERPESR